MALSPDQPSRHHSTGCGNCPRTEQHAFVLEGDEARRAPCATAPPTTRMISDGCRCGTRGEGWEGGWWWRLCVPVRFASFASMSAIETGLRHCTTGCPAKSDLQLETQASPGGAALLTQHGPREGNCALPPTKQSRLRRLPSMPPPSFSLEGASTAERTAARPPRAARLRAPRCRTARRRGC